MNTVDRQPGQHRSRLPRPSTAFSTHRAEIVSRLLVRPDRVKRSGGIRRGFTTTRFEMDFREGGAYRLLGPLRGSRSPRRTAPTASSIRRTGSSWSFQWDSGGAAHDRPTLVKPVPSKIRVADKTLLTFRQEPFAVRGGATSATARAGARCSNAFASIRWPERNARHDPPLSAFPWVPPFAQGPVRDLRVAGRSKKRGSPIGSDADRDRATRRRGPIARCSRSARSPSIEEGGLGALEIRRDRHAPGRTIRGASAVDPAFGRGRRHGCWRR